MSRAVESGAVTDFLDCAARGPAGLVVEGEAGIGKTTVWLAARELASTRGFRVLSAQPAATESVLAYASLADLLVGVDDTTLTALPELQRRAIDQVMLRASSDSTFTDQRAVAAAFLSILEGLGQDSPVLVAIDDLQWLDPSTVNVVSFAARRLSGRVGVLGAVRTDPHGGAPVAWLQLPRPGAITRLRVTPLSLSEVHLAVAERMGRSFPRAVMVRIHEISGGNPFYALELARAVGDDPTGDEASLPATLAELVQTRIGDLDVAVQQVLLALACVAAPTVDLVAAAIGGDTHVVAALEHAEDDGIIAIDGHRLRFTHPLLAQGVYAHATPARRRQMHQRLAGLVEQPEVAARHLALATTTRDPATLQALDHAAEIARRRGAPAAAAELLDLAIGRGGDTPHRRILLAQNHFDAGNLARARVLLEQTIDILPPEPLRAEAWSVLAFVHLMDDSFAEALACLDRALDDVGDQLTLQVQILNTVSFCLLMTGDLAAALHNAENALTHAESLGQAQLLSPALSMRTMLAALRGDGVDEESLRRALELDEHNADAYIFLRPRFHNILILAWLGRLDEAVTDLQHLKQGCIESGKETEVIVAAFNYVVGSVWLGDLSEAAAVAQDAMERAQQIGGDQAMMTALAMRATVFAYTGEIDKARSDLGEALVASTRGSERLLAGWQLATLGFVEVSIGNYDAAVAILEPLLAMFHATPLATEIFVAAFLPDAVEAFVGLGRLDDAEPLIAALETNGQRLDRAWMLAVGARCRALVLAARGDIDAATLVAQRAMTEHERLPMPFERARTLLLVGQLHRRARRKDAAAVALREAMRDFETIGTPVWADRARTELTRVAVGPRRTSELTPSEQRVAELAASGMTNRDVAAALFISPKTVEANLSRIYYKLGIRSRAELGRRIGRSDGQETSA